MNDLAAAFPPLRETIRTQTQQITGAIQASGIQNPVTTEGHIRALRTALEGVQESLEGLADWNRDELVQIPLINVPIFDMDGVQGAAVNLAVKYAKEEVKGLSELLRDPNTYRGIFNHLFFIPYLEAKG